MTLRFLSRWLGTSGGTGKGRGTTALPPKRARYRARLELLEERLAPAVRAWDGGPLGLGTNWCDPVNWVEDIAPGPGDDARVGSAFRLQTLHAPTNCTTTMRTVSTGAAVEVRSGATFRLVDQFNSESTVDNTLRVLPGGTLHLQSVHLAGTGSLTVAGTLELASISFAQPAINIPVSNQGMITLTISCTCGGFRFLRPFHNAAAGVLRLHAGLMDFSTGLTNEGRIELGSTGSSIVRVLSGTLENRGRLESRNIAGLGGNLVNYGSVEVLSGSLTFGTSGTHTVTNTEAGLIAASGGNATFDFSFTSRVTFRNQGRLVIAPSRLVVAVGQFASFQGNTLTEGTYETRGTFRFRDANIVTNAAAILLHDSGVIQNTANPPASALDNFTTNTGRFSLYGTAGHRAAAFTNSGTVTVGYPSTFVVLGGAYTQTAGVTTLEYGTLAAVTISLQGGRLDGSGWLVGNVVNAALVRVGADGSAGVLILDGSYTQTAAGTLEIYLGGTDPVTQTSLFYATGAATLAGTLRVVPVNDYQPSPGDFFFLLYFEQGIADDFDLFEGLHFSDGVSLYPFTDGFGYYLYAYLR